MVMKQENNMARYGGLMKKKHHHSFIHIIYIHHHTIIFALSVNFIFTEIINLRLDIQPFLHHNGGPKGLGSKHKEILIIMCICVKQFFKQVKGIIVIQ